MEWNGILLFLNDNLISILLCLFVFVFLFWQQACKVLGVWPYFRTLWKL